MKKLYQEKVKLSISTPDNYLPEIIGQEIIGCCQFKLEVNFGENFMNSRQIIVRIINPSVEPALPKFTPLINLKASKPQLTKSANIAVGSASGVMVGLVVYSMLHFCGLNLGGLESLIIISLPALLGIVTSLAVF